MLTIDVGRIPPEGMDIQSLLVASDLEIGEGDGVRLVEGAAVACHVERSDEGGVHVRGHLTAEVSLECSRCLEEYVQAVPAEVDLFFLPQTPGVSSEAEEEVELSDRDMVVSYYAGETLHLGEALREQVLFSAPMKPLCAESCAGRCPACGANRNQVSCACAREEPAPDPRLASLKNLLDSNSH
jgi:uncharacterized protein